MHFLRYLAGVATFCPLNSRRIKRSRASEQSDQAIKDDFHRSRFLIPVANTSTGELYVTTPCTRILPFASAVGGGWSGTSEFVLYTSPTAKFQEEPNERGTTTHQPHKEHTSQNSYKLWHNDYGFICALHYPPLP